MMSGKLCGIAVITVSLFLLSSCTVQTSASKGNRQSSSSVSVSSAASKSKLFKGVDSSYLDNPKTYTDKHFNFSVSYPADWKTDIEKYLEATSGQEAAPDGGIDIYVEGSKSDTIRIFGQIGTVSTGIIDFNYTTDTTEDFVTKDGLLGNFYYNDDNQTKRMVLLFDEHHAVQMKISDAAFTRDKQQIYAMLKSIKIIKS